MRRTATAAVSLGALAGLLAACTLHTGAPRPVRPAAAVVGPATGALAAGGTLPVLAYEFTPGQVKRQGIAYTLLLNGCLTRFGFGGLPQPSTDVRDFDVMIGRYGADADGYAVSGYHYKRYYISGRATDAPPSWAAGDRSAAGGAPSAEQESVLTGSVRTYGGSVVPEGGCDGEAKRRLTAGGGYYGTPELPGRIDADSFDRSAADPRVRAAVARWSACMAERGHPYPDPLAAASDRRWNTAAPSDGELATARADLDCKRRTGLVPLWLGVEQELQNAEIEQHRAELETVRAGEQAALGTVAAVTGPAA
ncbi:hypothetical protein [Kitasatospora cinereorecta]|uniref:Lipoprotein n=1 Tax=Kitasatospora cinereorecta TaxID=285560 RepID=A0ABW0VML3_9ACTN